MLEERFYSLGRHFKDVFDERVHKINVNVPASGGGGAFHLCTGGVLSHFHEVAVNLPVREQIANAKERVRQKFKLGKFMACLHTAPSDPVSLDDLGRAVDEVLTDNETLGISLTILPDSLTAETGNFLKKTSKHTSIWVEPSLHTIHDSTLRRIGMTHTYAQTKEALLSLLNSRMHVAAHVVFGLPGETPEMEKQTIVEVSKLCLSGINIHCFHVLKNSPFEQEFAEGKLRLLEREEYTGLVCDFIELLPPSAVLHGICDGVAEDRLVAPDWMRFRKENLDLITSTLEKRGSVQGCKIDEWTIIKTPPKPTPADVVPVESAAVEVESAGNG
ncbi:MAG: hypothetical protein HY280_06385 [Nitrospinae bacterium]|nr:hypothetical protein [Nitrospinota bacterium]